MANRKPTEVNVSQPYNLSLSQVTSCLLSEPSHIAWTCFSPPVRYIVNAMMVLGSDCFLLLGFYSIPGLQVCADHCETRDVGIKEVPGLSCL